MESKSITKERAFSALEIAEMLGITYSAVQGRLLRVNAQPIKSKRVLDKYSDSDLDKLKIPRDKRFDTETFIIYESKMNYTT
jgi:hypothetical protein